MIAATSGRTRRLAELRLSELLAVRRTLRAVDGADDASDEATDPDPDGARPDGVLPPTTQSRTVGAST